MKTKINLTLDKEIISLAERYARKKRQSVSQLIESLLWEQIRSEQPSFSEKWLGHFRIVEKRDARYEKLAKRYQL